MPASVLLAIRSSYTINILFYIFSNTFRMFFLCLSRACLGKCSVVAIKWSRKKDASQSAHPELLLERHRHPLGEHPSHFRGTCWEYYWHMLDIPGGSACRSWLGCSARSGTYTCRHSQSSRHYCPTSNGCASGTSNLREDETRHPLWFDFSLRLFVPSLSR